MRKLLRVQEYYDIITDAVIWQNKLKKKLDDIDEQGERNKLIESINKHQETIDNCKKSIEFLKNIIDEIPECDKKNILKDYFISQKTLKEITFKYRCCRQTIYNIIERIGAKVNE